MTAPLGSGWSPTKQVHAWELGQLSLTCYHSGPHPSPWLQASPGPLYSLSPLIFHLVFFYRAETERGLSRKHIIEGKFRGWGVDEAGSGSLKGTENVLRIPGIEVWHGVAEGA